MSIFGSIFSAILGGISSSSKEKSSAKLTKAELEESGKQDRLTLLLKSGEDRKSTAFAAGLEDWYKQRDRKEKRDALGNYSGFSTMSQFAPNYNASAFTPVQPGAMPNPIKYGLDSNYPSITQNASLSNYKRTP